MSQHDLPLPDYDGLPLGSIESRIRMLDVEGVEQCWSTNSSTPTA